MGIHGIGMTGGSPLRGPLEGPGSTSSPTGEAGAFGNLLAQLSSASGDADSAIAELATGGERDLHDVMLAMEMESLSFELAVQVRNRLVEAYSEIFRMQV
jgi:flagellar hook-basal body complex protein FliE